MLFVSNRATILADETFCSIKLGFLARFTLPPPVNPPIDSLGTPHALIRFAAVCMVACAVVSCEKIRTFYCSTYFLNREIATSTDIPAPVILRYASAYRGGMG